MSNIPKSFNKKRLFSSFAIALLTINLCACTTLGIKKNKSIDKIDKNGEITKTAGDIASQPLKDVGIIRNDVPPELAQITDPYAIPPGADCNWINYQIGLLDKVLGPEAVKESNVDDRDVTDKGTDIAKTAAKDAARSAVLGYIPARGILRKVSGADKRDKNLSKAIERGKIRRGYLKGLSYSKKCNKDK